MIHNHEVPGSIPGPATKKPLKRVVFLLSYLTAVFDGSGDGSEDETAVGVLG